MKKIDILLKELSQICLEKRYSLVTAESCTGGGLSYFITKDPACSAILERAYVVYSVAAKEELLDISATALQLHGAVSEEVAREMSEKALEKSKAHISIAITGIDEASVEKQGGGEAGIVWISCAGVDKKTIAKKFHIKGERAAFCEKVILESVQMALNFSK